MEKNNKKGTIKEILNKNNFGDNSKPSTNDDKISTVDSEVDKEQNDTYNNINSNGESSVHNEHSNNSNSNDSNRTPDNSNNFFLDIMVLNELSQACQLAMNNISFLSNIISSKKMKKDLVAIYSQYANILLQIDQHFEKFGEIPDNVSSYMKTMSICGLKMNTKFDKSNSHIAEMMIEGETMGIIKCQKIINCDYDIQESTINLMIKFRDFQKDNISKLNAYL
ncbi:MAG: hypothetical protein IKG56_00805 [Clostridia bacterium]|nr:hypothetical protein [Clostridia bacterium]